MTASLAVTLLGAEQRAVLGGAVLFKGALLWSALDGDDSLALYLLASRTTVPVTRLANKASELLKLYHATKCGVKAAATSGAPRMLTPCAWKLHKDGDAAGFILHDGAAARGGAVLPSARDGGAGCPLLHLQGGRDACRMATWQQHGLQVIVLLRGAAAVHAGDFAAARREIARHVADLDKCAVEGWSFAEHGRAEPGSLATAALARIVAAHAKGHIQGSRYAFNDHGGPFACATPVAKLAACSGTSLTLASHLAQDCFAHLRVEAQRRKERRDRLLFPESLGSRRLPVSSTPAGAAPHAPPSTGKLALHLASMGLEAAALGQSDRWVTAQWGAGCELLQLVETAVGEDCFLRVHDQTRHFAHAHFPGALGP